MAAIVDWHDRMILTRAARRLCALGALGLGTLVVIGLGVPIAAPASAQEPARVGVLTIRSGPIASCGRQMEEGLQFALKERGGAIAGRKVEVFFGDSAGQPALTRAKTLELGAGRLSMEDLARVGAENTARVFGLYPRKGVLAPGSDADVVIIDPELEATVDDAFYHCRCEVSVYRGHKLRGLVRTAIVRGRIMVEDRQTVGAPGWGRYLARGDAAAA
jgi:Periplasmic binding protein/Amidohydrolase family